MGALFYEYNLGDDDRKISFAQVRRFSLREMQLATDNFSESNIIGQGGFGKVYRGVLSDNTKVAVKRLTDYYSPGGEAAFQREVELISVAVHRNLLRLIGFCTTLSERILVYPYMQNLSVAYHLRGNFVSRTGDGKRLRDSNSDSDKYTMFRSAHCSKSLNCSPRAVRCICYRTLTYIRFMQSYYVKDFLMHII